MYAKLTFNTSVAVGLKIRDIVRLITESASGSAALANLENIDTGNSELVAGLNSGWTLADGYTLPSSGTAVSATDAQYILEGTCVDTTKKKYVSVHANASFTATAGYSATTTGVILGPVVNFGESDEETMVGYSSTSTSYSDEFGFLAKEDVIHVFASPRRVVLTGNHKTAGTHYGIMAHCEFAENEATDYYNLPPVMWFMRGSYRGNEQIDWAKRQTSGTIRDGYMCPALFFPGSWCDPSRDLFPRYYSTMDEYEYAGSSNTRINVYDGTADGLAYLDDTDPISYDYTMSPRFLIGIGNSSNYVTTNAQWSNFTGKDVNASTGAFDVPLVPLQGRFDNGFGLVNLAQCNIFRTLGSGMGNNGDNLSVGSDDYFLFTGNIASTGWGLAIKKE